MRRVARGEPTLPGAVEQHLADLASALRDSTHARHVVTALKLLARGEGEGIFARVLDVAESAAPEAYAAALLELASGPPVDHPWYYIALLRAVQAPAIAAEIGRQAPRRPYPQRKRLRSQIERFLGHTPPEQRNVMESLCEGL